VLAREAYKKPLSVTSLEGAGIKIIKNKKAIVTTIAFTYNILIVR